MTNTVTENIGTLHTTDLSHDLSADAPTMTNITEAGPTLTELNDEEVARLVPTLIYLGIISVTGIFGNGLVCHIYRTRYRLSNSQCFILCLGAIDLFSCLVVIPFEITTVINQYTFRYLWLCKLSRFFNTTSTLSSSFLLLFIAIDRYRKVCKPFKKQISAKVAKFLCALAVLLGLFFSWPAVLVYGKKTFHIPEYNLVGTECSTDDSMSDTMYPFMNVAMYAVLFLSGIISMSVLYCFIGREVQEHVNRMPKEYIQASNSVPMLSSSMVDRGSKAEGEIDVSTLSRYEKAKIKNVEHRKRVKRFKKKHKSASELSWSEKPDEKSEQYEMKETYQKENEKGEQIENDSGQTSVASVEQHCVENGANVDKDQVNKQKDDINVEGIDLKNSFELNKPDTNDNQDKPGDTNSSSEKLDDQNKPNGQSPISSEESLNKERKSLGGRLVSITSQMSSILSRMTSITSRQSETNISTLGKTQYLKQARARKTAFLMFCISLAFVLSYLPHLLLMLMRALNDDFVDNMSDTGRAAYRFFLRSYFLQCMINPIIYAACASRFRNECAELFNGLCGKAESGQISPQK